MFFARRKGELQDDFELRAVSSVQDGIHLICRSKVLWIYHHRAHSAFCQFSLMSAVFSWRYLIVWGTWAFSKRCLVVPVTGFLGVMLSPIGPGIPHTYTVILLHLHLCWTAYGHLPPLHFCDNQQKLIDDGKHMQKLSHRHQPTFCTTASFEQVEKCETDAAPLSFFRFKHESEPVIMCTSNRRWQHPAACSQELKCSAAIDFSFATTVGKWIQQRLSQSARSLSSSFWSNEFNHNYIF